MFSVPISVKNKKEMILPICLENSRELYLKSNVRNIVFIGSLVLKILFHCCSVLLVSLEVFPCLLQDPTESLISFRSSPFPYLHQMQSQRNSGDWERG